METPNTNTLEEQETPLLITAGMVPSGESLPSQPPVETTELIEVPEELKATSTERQLGHFATRVPVEQVNTDAATGDVIIKHPATDESNEGGRFNNGVVPLGDSRFSNGKIPVLEVKQ